MLEQLEMPLSIRQAKLLQFVWAAVCCVWLKTLRTPALACITITLNIQLNDWQRA